MNKNRIIALFAIVVLAIIYVYAARRQEPPTQSTVKKVDPYVFLKNSTFTIDGVSTTLKNGISEVPAAPGSASKITTRYFGNEGKGDFNGDGIEDVVFLVTQDGSGSGLFYYAVAALGAAGGNKMTNAFFIGDRIAPQSTEVPDSGREIHINYAERNPSEPMTTQPSRGAVKLLKVTPLGVLNGLMQ